jgi:hypothetical protein
MNIQQTILAYCCVAAFIASLAASIIAFALGRIDVAIYFLLLSLLLQQLSGMRLAI